METTSNATVGEGATTTVQQGQESLAPIKTLENENRILKQIMDIGFQVSDDKEIEIRNGIRSDNPEFSVRLPATTEKGIETDNDLLFRKHVNTFYWNAYISTIVNLPIDEVASRPVRESVNTRFPTNTMTLEQSVAMRLRGAVEKQIAYSVFNEAKGVNVVQKFKTWKVSNQKKLDEYGFFQVDNVKYLTLETDLQKRKIIGIDNPDNFSSMLAQLKNGQSVPVTLLNGKQELQKFMAVDIHAIGDKLRFYDNDPRIAKATILEPGLAYVPSQNVVGEGQSPVQNAAVTKASNVAQVPEDIPTDQKEKQIIQTDKSQKVKTSKINETPAKTSGKKASKAIEESVGDSKAEKESKSKSRKFKM